MPLAVGDDLKFDGQLGTVRAVTSTTDANGRGTVDCDGNTFSFRALKATVNSTAYPLVATADAVFRVGVVQQDADPTLFCLVLDDGPAPWGWGRQVQGVGAGAPTYWAEASEFAAADSVVFVMGWAPGEITIKKGGVAEAGVYADLVFTYSVEAGASTYAAWWQPAYPSQAGDTWGAAEGRFYTDANGVLWDVTDGTQQPIIVPCGFGALGYRSEEDDGWASCPTSERTLSKLEVWYLQESAEVSEGAGTTLDVAACELTVTGPTDGTAVIFWENGPMRGTAELGGDGTHTFTDLPPGSYQVAMYHNTQAIYGGLARQEVALEASGDTATVSFGAFTDYSADSNHVTGIVYSYGAEPLAGVPVYAFYQLGPTPNAAWHGMDVTDGSGGFDFEVPSGASSLYLGVIDETWGTCIISMPGMPFAGIWWDPCLAASFGGEYAPATIGGNPPEGIVPWGAAGPHVNLPAQKRFGYVQNETTGTKYYFKAATHGGGFVTDPAPRWAWDTAVGWAGGVGASRYVYSIRDADGTLIESPSYKNLDGDPFPPWASSGDWYYQNTRGVRLSDDVGGKIDGNVVEASRGELITTADLIEAARMGLETGKFTQPLEVRGDSETVAAEAAPTTFGSWECPYCGGPAHMGPDDVANGFKRGYCLPCGYIGGATVDCRTYFLSPTLAALADWTTRLVKNTTAGRHVDKLVTGWPRPAEYYESNPYLVDPWVDGLPRWVAVHIVLGTLAGGVFTDGESIADAEARLSETIGPVQLKVLLTADYAGAGQSVGVIATRADGGGSAALMAAVPAGSSSGDIVLLRYGSHDTYPGSPCRWFTDVLNAWDDPSEWEPSQDYAVGRIDTYEGVTWSGVCRDSVIAFWNQVLGISDTAALLAAMATENFPFDSSVLPAGATQVVSTDYDSAPNGAILYLDTTLSPETLAHVGIIHRYEGGTTKLANTNHAPLPGDSLGYMNNVTDFTGLTVFGWIAPPSEPETVACQVVNDGPSWRSSAGCIVTHQAYSPWACDVFFSIGGSLDHLRDLEGRLQVYYENGSGQLVRRWYVPTDDAFTETILWPTQTADSHPNIMRPAGSSALTLLFIRDADEVLAAQSLDNGRTWGDPLSIATGYSIAEAEIDGPRNLIVALLYDGNDWKRAVLEWVPATAQWQVHGSVAQLASGADVRGSLRRESDGSFSFVYVDADDAVQLLRGHLDQGNSLTWS